MVLQTRRDNHAILGSRGREVHISQEVAQCVLILFGEGPSLSARGNLADDDL